MAETSTANKAGTNSGSSRAGLTLETDHGVTTIADVVVAKLAGHSAREVEGVASMGSTFRRFLSRVTPGEEGIAQGVNVEVGTREAAIDLVILVQYGFSIPELAQTVRQNVISRIESATGLIVKEVNIEVDDLVFDEEPTGSRVE